MFRLAEYRCECGFVCEDLIDVPHGETIPRQAILECSECGTMTQQDRIMSAPAQYMGEKVLNPRISGGRFDTMGYVTPPSLPDLPGADEHSERVCADMGRLPENASKEDYKEVRRRHRRDSPSDADYAALFSTSEYREAAAERKRVVRQNAVKRERAAALARGDNINFRRDRVDGDPNMTS